MKADRKQIEMTEDELVQKWLSAFGKDVDKGMMKGHGRLNRTGEAYETV